MGRSVPQRALVLSRKLRDLTVGLDAFRNAASVATGLNCSDMRALRLIVREDRIPAGALAARLGLSSGAVTGLLDRLERSGYAHRVQDDEDRRHVIARPTQKGRNTVAAVFYRVPERLLPIMAGYSDHDLDVLDDFMDRAARVMQEHAAELRDLGPPKP